MALPKGLKKAQWISSHDKWKAIIAALEIDDGVAFRRAMNTDCAYCDAFLHNQAEDDEEECGACPLYERDACRNDPNDFYAYWRVAKYEPLLNNRDSALSAAREVLRAIEEDRP